MRADSTKAENVLWQALRNRQLEGLKFRRQVPLDGYIIDFVCFDARLIVEVDGGQHTPETDAIRTRHLEHEGYRVLRFWNNDVLANTEGVIMQISLSLREREEAAKPPKGEGDRTRE